MNLKWTDKRQQNLLFLLCWAAYVTVYLGRYNFSSALADMVTREVLTKSQGGIIATCFYITYGASQVLSGFLGDKLDARRMVGIGLGVSGIMNLLIGLTSSWKVMTAMWMVNGLAQSMVWSPMLRLLAEELPRQRCLKAGIDIATTVPKIIAGRKFDNGIICSGEQTAICPKEDYDAIMAEFVKNGAYYIEGGEERARLTEALFPNGVMNKNLVGQSVKKVAEAAGIELPEGTKVIVVKADGCGRASYLAKEKMCPVIASYAYDTFEEAVAIAQANLDYEGKGHSVSLHTNDIEHARFAGQKLEVARILVNQICSTMNGGALTNCLTPTTTLGCCSWGNNSISENFSHKFLLNVIRVAYPKKDTRIPTDDEIWG